MAGIEIGVEIQTDYKLLDVRCNIGHVSVSTAQWPNLGRVAHHCHFTHLPCAIKPFGPEAECKALNAKRILKQVCLAVTEAHTYTSNTKSHALAYADAL